MLAFYGALRGLGVDVDVRRPDAPLAGYRLIVVPCLPMVEHALVRNLEDAGATCVFGPRTGSRTESHRISTAMPPGPLQARLPLKVTRVESLPPSLVEQVTWGNRGHPVRHWREAIETELEAEAHFDDGTGAIYAHRDWHYLAFWPDEAFLIDYIERLLAARGVATQRLAETLRLRRRGKLTFAFNYGVAPIDAPAPADADFVLGQREMAPRDVVAWRHP